MKIAGGKALHAKEQEQGEFIMDPIQYMIGILIIVSNEVFPYEEKN